MSEILKEYDKQTQTKAKRAYSFKRFFIYFAVICVIVMLGIYVGNMFFGKRSLDVMLGLQTKKERLIEDVETLKRYNAQLQKEYFELKELEPESGKK
ncbi:septum formation initiator [Campylobacter sp. 9BO]|uniref:septum formation initiator n=1 Tax=Campylobacter sp. 9BO TaxID=3424759 RepID=UPI003D351F65